MRKHISFIIVIAHLLLFVSCAQGIYKLAGGKSPRVENASRLQNFLTLRDSLPALHTYLHESPLDSATLLNFDTLWTTKFFDPNGNELLPKNGNDFSTFFAYHTVNADSVLVHFQLTADSSKNLANSLTPLRTLANEKINVLNYYGKYVVLIPWMKYALYNEMRKEVADIAKIIREKNVPLEIILMNTDFQESWGLPLGKKVAGKYIWNKSERSVQATYNVLPLMKDAQ